MNDFFWSVLYELPELILGLLLVTLIVAAHGAGRWARGHFSGFADTQSLGWLRASSACGLFDFGSADAIDQLHLLDGRRRL